LGRQNKKDFWWSIFYGIAPDLFSFGIFTGMTILGLASSPSWSSGLPLESAIPPFIHTLYRITHSLVIFAVIFLAVWLLRKKPLIPMLAWGIHILMDIPTHSMEFFPTPFLWPFFNGIRFSGISWGHPIIFIPDVILLFVLYIWFFIIKPKRYNKIKP